MLPGIVALPLDSYLSLQGTRLTKSRPHLEKLVSSILTTMGAKPHTLNRVNWQ